MHFKCRSCGSAIQGHTSLVGAEISCPVCGTTGNVSRTTLRPAETAGRIDKPSSCVVRCQHCDVRLKVPSKKLGTDITCPKCGGEFFAAAAGKTGIAESAIDSTRQEPMTAASVAYAGDDDNLPLVDEVEEKPAQSPTRVQENSDAAAVPEKSMMMPAIILSLFLCFLIVGLGVIGVLILSDRKPAPALPRIIQPQAREVEVPRQTARPAVESPAEERKRRLLTIFEESLPGLREVPEINPKLRGYWRIWSLAMSAENYKTHQMPGTSLYYVSANNVVVMDENRSNMVPTVIATSNNCVQAVWFLSPIDSANSVTVAWVITKADGDNFVLHLSKSTGSEPAVSQRM